MISDAVWEPARAAASSLVPAENWRAALADLARNACHCEFVCVVTCPPDQPLEGNGNTSPSDAADLMRDILTRFLPKIERGDDSATIGEGRIYTYAPLESAINQEQSINRAAP